MLDLALLRTFALVVDQRSVTRVARQLGRTQPAISLQLRRLESAVGHPLFERDLRHLTLSRRGEELLRYARELLALHEEAQARLSAEELSGRVVLGCPDLYAAFLLPNTLASFRRSYPQVEISVRCALSAVLADEISEGLVDLALATSMPRVAPRSATTIQLRWEPLVWIGAIGGSAHLRTPLPLAMLPEGNLYRDHALGSLAKVGKAWQIACTSESVAGLAAMALADAAVTVLARSSLPAGLQELSERDCSPPLPPLSPVRLVLWNRLPGASAAVDKLAHHIAEQMH
jgi:DNA-binding transcriptional LysR family regulator